MESRMEQLSLSEAQGVSSGQNAPDKDLQGVAMAPEIPAAGALLAKDEMRAVTGQYNHRKEIDKEQMGGGGGGTAEAPSHAFRRSAGEEEGLSSGPENSSGLTNSQGDISSEDLEYGYQQDSEEEDDDEDDEEDESMHMEECGDRAPGPRVDEVDIHVITEKERAMLVHSWDLIQDRVFTVGVSAYNELFRMSPQAIQFFPKLNGLEEANDEQFKEILKDHSISCRKRYQDHLKMEWFTGRKLIIFLILGIIGLTIRDISKLSGKDPKEYYSFYKFAFQLGEKHFRYGANPRLMGLLGHAFAYAMKQNLLEYDNCNEVEEAWKSYFTVVTSWMRRGFLYVQNKGREQMVYKIPLEDFLGHSN